MSDTRPGAFDDQPGTARKIRFDGTVNFGHVLTFAAAMLAGFTAWNGMDKRLVVLEEARKVQIERDATQDQASRERMFDIAQLLNKIDHRLDRIGDRLNDQNQAQAQAALRSKK